MAQLTAESLGQVRADIMRQWSRDQLPVPITKPDLSALLSIMDVALKDAEIAVITAIPQQHPGRQWLINNQAIARRVLELVEAKRREML